MYYPYIQPIPILLSSIVAKVSSTRLLLLMPLPVMTLPRGQTPTWHHCYQMATIIMAQSPKNLHILIGEDGSCHDASKPMALNQEQEIKSIHWPVLASFIISESNSDLLVSLIISANDNCAASLTVINTTVPLNFCTPCIDTHMNKLNKVFQVVNIIVLPFHRCPNEQEFHINSWSIIAHLDTHDNL